MFSKKNRMTKSEFSLLWENGRRIHTRDITIVSLPSDTLKVSVVVGKKVNKIAAERNAIRRRVYGIVKSMLPFPKNREVIIIIKKTFTTLSKSEQKNLVTDMFAHLCNLR
jgi:ribonuclease P protein component